MKRGTSDRVLSAGGPFSCSLRKPYGMISCISNIFDGLLKMHILDDCRLREWFAELVTLLYTILSRMPSWFDPFFPPKHRIHPKKLFRDQLSCFLYMFINNLSSFMNVSYCIFRLFVVYFYIISHDDGVKLYENLFICLR